MDRSIALRLVLGVVFFNVFAHRNSGKDDHQPAFKFFFTVAVGAVQTEGPDQITRSTHGFNKNSETKQESASSWLSPLPKVQKYLEQLKYAICKKHVC
jgi:hypothetical protein